MHLCITSFMLVFFVDRLGDVMKSSSDSTAVGPGVGLWLGQSLNPRLLPFCDVVAIAIGVVRHEELPRATVGVLMIDVALWTGVSEVWGRVGRGTDGGTSDDWWTDPGVSDRESVKHKSLLLYWVTSYVYGNE